MVVANLGFRWWITFDDMNEKLIFRPRQKVMSPLLKVPGWTKHRETFPESCITSVLWQDEINYEVRDA